MLCQCLWENWFFKQYIAESLKVLKRSHVTEFEEAFRKLEFLKQNLVGVDSDSYVCKSAHFHEGKSNFMLLQ